MKAALIYIFLGALFDTFGDLLMRYWVVNQSKTIFICGMVFYIIGLSFLAYSFTLKNFVSATVIFLILNVLLLILVNTFFFNELLTKKEYFAVGLGLIAIILFEIK